MESNTDYTVEFISQSYHPFVKITCDQEPNHCANVAWPNFSSEFMYSRSFSLSNIQLPNVVQYQSPTFDYQEQKVAFCFVSMLPKLVSYDNELGENVSGYIPWTHFFLLLNVDTKQIIECILFFSKEQIKSEYLHSFYIPNIDSKYLKKSPFFESFFGIKVPVLSVFNTDIKVENKELFHNEFINIRSCMEHFFVSNAEWDYPIIDNLNDFETSFSDMVRSDISPISISVFENKACELQFEVQSFQSLVESLYEKYKVKEKTLV